MSYLRTLAGLALTGAGLVLVATGDAITLIGIRIEGASK